MAQVKKEKTRENVAQEKGRGGDDSGKGKWKKCDNVAYVSADKSDSAGMHTSISSSTFEDSAMSLS